MAPTTYGLGWDGGLNGLAANPIWTEEPDLTVMEQICREKLNLAAEEKCEIRPLGKGAGNKVYEVVMDDASVIMRVALPLDPEKVVNEVVTMQFVAEKTTIPVPQVINFDTSNDNALCFPWILMTKAEGTSLGPIWRSMSLERKKKIIIQLADVQTQLARSTTFTSIGGLDVLPEDESQYCLTRMTADTCHLPNRVSPTTLGPHSTSEAWIRARLELFKWRLALGDPPPAKTSTQKSPQRMMWESQEADRIFDFLPGCYASSSPETTTLFHSDLHPGNIFVDENDTITSILDWEFLITAPGWMSHGLPKLLITRDRQVAPERRRYYLPEIGPGEREFDSNNWVAMAYHRDVEEYHTSFLRPIFIEEMERLTPGWRGVYEATKFHRVLEDHVDSLERSLEIGGVAGWPEAYEGEGKVPVGDEEWPKVWEDTPCVLFAGFLGAEDDDEEDENMNTGAVADEVAASVVKEPGEDHYLAEGSKGRGCQKGL